MKKIKYFFRISALILTIIFIVENAVAQDFKVKPETIPLTFKKKDATGVVSDIKNIEPSAVETIGNGRYLLVADDKDDNTGRSLKIVEASSRIVIKLLENIQGEVRNPKWEAMAKDDEGNFYVIGSHSGPDPDKLAARSRLFRFRLKNEVATDPNNFAIDLTSVRELDIKDSLTSLEFYGSVPEGQKVKIEGLAVRTSSCGKELVVGFREPFESSRVQFYFAELPSGSELPNSVTKLSLKPLFEFAAGKPENGTLPFKLSSIEYVKELKGFLVLTSTEDPNDNSFQGNALWFVSNEMVKKAQPTKFSKSFEPVLPKKFPEFEPKMKVEGLSVFPITDVNKIRLVIVYDNDAITPGMIQFLELSKSP